MRWQPFWRPLLYPCSEQSFSCLYPCPRQQFSCPVYLDAHKVAQSHHLVALAAFENPLLAPAPPLDLLMLPPSHIALAREA